jgi:hypothetical protein
MSLYGLDIMAEHVTFQSFKKINTQTLIVIPTYNILRKTFSRINNHVHIIDDKAISRMVEDEIQFLNGSTIYFRSADHIKQGGIKGRQLNIAVNLFECFDPELECIIIPQLVSDVSNELLDVYEFHNKYIHG